MFGYSANVNVWKPLAYCKADEHAKSIHFIYLSLPEELLNLFFVSYLGNGCQQRLLIRRQHHHRNTSSQHIPDVIRVHEFWLYMQYGLSFRINEKRCEFFLMVGFHRPNTRPGLGPKIADLRCTT